MLRPLTVVAALLLGLESLLTAQDQDTVGLLNEAVSAYYAGDMDASIALLSQYLALQPKDPIGAYDMAACHAEKGDAEQTLAWLRSAADWGLSSTSMIELRPEFEGLLGDPRLAPILEQIHRNRDQLRDRRRRARSALEEEWRARQQSPVQWLDRHGSTVYLVRLSPDGTRAVTACHDRTVRLWDVETGDSLATLGTHSHRDLDLLFSVDGERLLIQDANSGRATLWDGRTGRLVARLWQGDDIVTFARFTPDGARLATVTMGGVIRFWDARRGTLLPAPEFQVTEPLDIQFDPKGQRALVCSQTSVQVFDTRTGAALGAVGDDTVYRYWGWFQADGSGLVTADEDGNVRLWDAEDYRHPVTVLEGGPSNHLLRNQAWRGPMGQRYLTLTEHGLTLCSREGDRISTLLPPGEVPRHMSWRADGARLAVTRHDKPALLFDAKDGVLVGEVGRPFVEPLRWTLFGPGEMGLYAVSGVNAQLVERYHPDSGKFLHQVFGGQGGIYAMTFAGGNQACAVTNTGAVVFWTDEEGSARKHSARARAVSDLLLGPEGGQVLVASNPTRYWDPVAGEPGKASSNLGFKCVADSPSDHSVIAARRSGRWHVGRLDADTLEPVDTMVVERRYLLVDAVPHPLGERIAVLRRDGLVELLTAKGNLIRRLPGPSNPGSEGIDTCLPVFRPDSGAELITANSSHDVLVLDSQYGELLHRLGGHTDIITGLDFTRDGSLLLSSSKDGTIRIWSAQPWRETELAILESGTGDCRAAWFHPVDELLASAHEDGSVLLWRPDDPVPLAHLDRHFGQSVRLLRFSPDGSRLLSASVDGLMCLWSIPDGRFLGELRGHGERVRSAAFSADGSRLFTVSNDRTFRTWDPASCRLLATTVQYGPDSWLTFEPGGHYRFEGDAPEVARIRVHDVEYPLSCYSEWLHAPEVVEASLAGERIPAPLLDPAPALHLLDPTSGTGTTEDQQITLEALIEDDLGIENVTVCLGDDEVPEEVVRAALHSSRGAREVRLSLPVSIPVDQEKVIEVRATNARSVHRTARLQVRHQPPTRELYLVALGVADYKTEDMRLRYPVADVDRIIAFFEAQEGDLYAEVKVERRVDDEVSPAEVLRLLDGFLANAEEEDTILVFLAGHGVRTGRDDYYFLTPEATAEDPYPGIRRQLLEELVLSPQLKARRRLLLLDTCNSGGIPGGRSGRGFTPLLDQERVDQLASAERGGVYILSASSAYETAREQAGNGIFTGALVQGLVGAADQEGDRNGLVEVEELFRYARLRVLDLSNGLQVPTMPRVDFGENFPLARVH